MKQNSLSAKAYTVIRKGILSGQLPANTRLKEERWATRLGVNRMALREAFNRLLGENLVRLGEKGGYFVSAFPPEDMHKIRELREILEIGAIRLLIKTLTKEKIDRLEKICNDYTAMVENEYTAGACEADLKFHETIMEFSENNRLVHAYQSSHIPLFHLKLNNLQRLTEDQQLAGKEHREILKAIKAKNTSLAEELLSKHFVRGADWMLNNKAAILQDAW